MNDQTLFSIFFSAMVVNNFTLALFLGLCPFMGVSARVETALRMGLANIFVLTLTSISAWFLNTYILETAPYLIVIFAQNYGLGPDGQKIKHYYGLGERQLRRYFAKAGRTSQRKLMEGEETLIQYWGTPRMPGPLNVNVPSEIVLT